MQMFKFFFLLVVYASFVFACIDLSDSGTYGTAIVSSSNSFYVNENVVLCTQTYSDLNPQSMFIFNASGISFDCNSSTFTNVDIANALYIPPSTSNLNIYGSCTFNDFSRILFSDGDFGALVNNLTVSNIYGSGTNDIGFRIEYTQNSSFINVRSNYSGQQGFYIEYSAYNNFTNITSIYSNTEGVYFNSESDQN
ncbi:hypothetical protein HY990_07470, partial [Candidatus Micrarchaeota archaeon]|nr:hypothetical protein [Candidatus Micrarchaeota archaeon]